MNPPIQFSHPSLVPLPIPAEGSEFTNAYADVLLAETARQHVSDVLSAVGETLCVLDADWRFVEVNQAFCEKFGLSSTEMLGFTPFDINPNFAKSVFFEAVRDTMDKQIPSSRLGFSERISRWMLFRGYPYRGGCVVFSNDASEQYVENFERAKQALHDTLTSLPNRLALSEDLALLTQTGIPFGLVFLDLNRFKQVNDALGHSGGDKALMLQAQRMNTRTRKEDKLYRMSGDEFVLLVENDATGNETRAQAEVLIAAALEPILIEQSEFTLGATAGISLYPQHGSTMDELVRRADMAMYKAKKEGSHQPRFFNSNMESDAVKKVQLEKEIRRALVNNEFQLVFQPKGDLVSGKVSGAEALIRWKHPQRGMVSPGEFLPVAEESGLMRSLDSWVIKCALDHVQKLVEHGIHLPVSINLSADGLQSPDMPAEIKAELAARNLPARILGIEITEGTAMKDVQTSQRVLHELSALGLKVSIDDFGTGYSSFAYLLRFEVNVLKIDRSFIQDITTDEQGYKVVKGLIRMARSIGLEVVAEGAETEEQLALLTKAKCNTVQGYGYGRPMPLDQFIEFVRAKGIEGVGDVNPFL